MWSCRACRNQNQVANVLRVQRQLRASAHPPPTARWPWHGPLCTPAKALREKPGVPGSRPRRIFSMPRHMVHDAHALLTAFVVNLHVNAKVAFDSRDGINGDSLCHRCLCLTQRCGRSELTNYLFCFVLAKMFPYLKYTVHQMYEAAGTGSNSPCCATRPTDRQNRRRFTAIRKPTMPSEMKFQRHQHFGGRWKIRRLRFGESERRRAEAINHRRPQN